MFVKGGQLPVHLVKCLLCGCELERRTYWRKPRCEPCRLANRQRNDAENIRRARQQARRYRIILHVLGWEDDQFLEMLGEMKRSPMMFRRKPETRAARLDLTLERRASA